MTDFGKPPEIPAEFQLYKCVPVLQILYALVVDRFPSSSYEEDPKWQRKFTIVWCSALAAATVLSLPYLVRSFRNGRLYTGMMGVSERWGYEPIAQKEEVRLQVRRSRRRALEGRLSVIGGMLLWTAPGIGLNVGQSTFILSDLSCVVAHKRFSRSYAPRCIRDHAHSVHRQRFDPRRQLKSRRVHGDRTTPCRLPLCNEKLYLVPLVGSWSRLREAQLHSPVVWSWYLPRCSHPRFIVDPEPSALRLTDTGTAEGDEWCRCAGCLVRTGFVFVEADKEMGI